MQLIRYNIPTATRCSNAVYNRSPWTGLEHEIDRLFSAAVSDLTSPMTVNRIPVDLYEDDQNAYVRAELPGVERDKIGVEVVDGVLNISAGRELGRGDTKSVVNASRAVKLREDVQADQVSARYENGVLTVTLPKQKKAEPRKVAVKVS